MKKIFCIISAVIIGMVGSFLTTIAIAKTESVAFDEPYLINVYNQSTTTINNKSYYAEDAEYVKVKNGVKNTIRTSLFTIMTNSGSLSERVVYGGSNYSKYDTTMKQSNLVIEFIYKDSKSVVCYEGENTRSISFTCLIMIIPIKNYYEDIVVYTSINNDSTLKEEEYKKSTPFIIKGNPSKLVNIVESL